MLPEIIIAPVFFLVIGIISVTYIYYRFKEKQIMLDRGLTPEQMLELLKSRDRKTSMLKIGIISIFFGIGLGLGISFEQYTDFDAAVPFSIFFFAGFGFVVAFLVERKYFTEK